MNKKRQKSVFNPFDATALFPYPQNTFLLFSGVIERTQPHQMGQDESFLENKTSVY